MQVDKVYSRTPYMQAEADRAHARAVQQHAARADAAVLMIGVVVFVAFVIGVFA